jgi:hypothetical protein
MWEPRRLTTLWAFTASYKDSFTFFLNMLVTSLITFIFFLKICYEYQHVVIYLIFSEKLLLTFLLITFLLTFYYLIYQDG